MLCLVGHCTLDLRAVLTNKCLVLVVSVELLQITVFSLCWFPPAVISFLMQFLQCFSVLQRTALCFVCKMCVQWKLPWCHWQLCPLVAATSHSVWDTTVQNVNYSGPFVKGTTFSYSIIQSLDKHSKVISEYNHIYNIWKWDTYSLSFSPHLSFSLSFSHI